jgi:hypothetical protein
MSESAPSDLTATRHRLAVAAGLALLVAGVLLVAVVLPAEFAVDPLGIGQRVGLLELGVVGQQVEQLTSAPTAGGSTTATVIVAKETPFHQETVDFVLQPAESIEYKYRLGKGEALLFSWKTTAPVEYDFHAEPDGAPRGYAESYEKGTDRTDASGTLTAPFAGIHGWYWLNTTGQPVTVTLTTSGFYTLAHEFRTGAPVKNKTFP